MYNGRRWLSQIDNIVREKLSDGNLDNETLAAQVAISERHLNRRVKALTGLSPQKYIRQYRLHLAINFLQNGKFKTVKEAASAIGYTNTSYFINQFEREFGQKPLKVLQESGWR